MMDQSGTWFYRKLDLSHSYRRSWRWSPGLQQESARELARYLQLPANPFFKKAALAAATVLVELSRSSRIELLWNIDYLADQVLAYRFSLSAPAHLAERTNSSMPGVHPMLKSQLI